MPRYKGSIIMSDGSRIGRRKAAARLPASEDAVIGAIRKVGCRYEDIKKYLFPFPSGRVAELDPAEVYKLGRYSKGQNDHLEILMQLLGLESSDKEDFIRRFPDA